MPRYILQQLDIHDPAMIKVASGVEVATMAWAVGTNPMGIGLSFEMRCLAGGLVWIGYEHLLQPATHQQALRSSSRRL